MAELDAETFGHHKFVINARELNFGQIDPSSLAYITVKPAMCEYNFTYSSSVVFPPAVIWTYTTTCGSPVLLSPAAFLQGLDESYGMVNYSSIPVGEGGGNEGGSPYSLEFSAFYNTLTSAQQSFLENQEFVEYYHGFIDYLILHQFSEDSKTHIVWCINNLLSNTTLITSFSEFAALHLNDFASLAFLSTVEINWLNNYPYLKSRIYYFLQNQFIIDAELKVQFHVNKMRTEGSYLAFNTAYSTYPQFKSVWFADETYLYKFGGPIFGDWAINNIMQNPTFPFENFQEENLSAGDACVSEVDISAITNPCLVAVLAHLTKADHNKYILKEYDANQLNNDGKLKKYKIK